MQKWKPKPEELEQLARDYIDNCLAGTKEFATSKGVVSVKERHIPTVEYFLNVWIPIVNKNNQAKGICKTTYYKWLQKDDSSSKTNAIKRIDALFKAVATDIVANEGKGIFYAKNRLGMTDKAQIDTKANINILTIDPLVGD